MQLTGTIGKREVVSISTQGQLTIPQKYYNLLGFGNEAECLLQDGGLLFRPLHSTSSNEFAEYILADLIAQGYEGQALLQKFKEKCGEVKPAVQKLIKEADEFAKSGEGRIPIAELFGEDD